MRSTSHSPSRNMAPSRSASQSPSRIFCKGQLLQRPLCQSVYNVNQSAVAPATGTSTAAGPKRPNYLPLNKPRILSRLAAKSKLQDLATEVLPKFDLSFLNSSDSGGSESSGKSSSVAADRMIDTSLDSLDSRPADGKKQHHSIIKSKSASKVHPGPTRTTSPSKVLPPRSPPVQKKRPFSGSGKASGSPLVSHRDKRTAGGSCKEAVDYEESLALAMALSRSASYETPLPVIPGLSQKTSCQDVLAHPHRDVSHVLPF